MKKYQQQRKLDNIKKGALCPFQPEYAAGDPAVDTTVYRWFDTDGKYLGWTSFENGRKFLYGKLYYKSKGKYQTKTRNSFRYKAKMIYIYEKGTDNVALYGALRAITKEDLVDLNDTTALIKATRDAINGFGMSIYNLHEFPNAYKIIPDTMKSKFHTDVEEFIVSKKKELIDFLNEYEKVLTAQRADEVALGIPIDI